MLSCLGMNLAISCASRRDSQRSRDARNVNATTLRTAGPPAKTRPSMSSERIADAKWSRTSARKIASHTSRVLSLGWNRGGAWLASASSDSAIRVCAVDSHASVRRFPAALPRLSRLTRPHGIAAQWKEVCSIKGHSKPAEDVAWSRRNDNLLASAGSDKTFRVWDVRCGSLCVVAPRAAAHAGGSQRRPGRRCRQALPRAT